MMAQARVLWDWRGVSCTRVCATRRDPRAHADERALDDLSPDCRETRHTEDVPPPVTAQCLERPVLKRIDSGDEPPRAPLAAPSPATPGQRIGRYLVALALLGAAVGIAAAVLFEATQCSGDDFDGECDLAGLAGIWYGFIAVGLGAVLIVLVEIVRALRRR